jgi:hypothetical protein
MTLRQIYCDLCGTDYAIAHNLVLAGNVGVGNAHTASSPTSPAIPGANSPQS